MKQKIFLAVVIVIALIGLSAQIYKDKDVVAPIITPVVTPTSTVPVITHVATSTDPLADLISVSVPKAGQVIVPGMSVSGKARGYWFFEASAPVYLYDAKGTQLAVFLLQPVGEEWMTTEFIPFKGTVSQFTAPKGSTGTMVFMNDNPSGEEGRRYRKVIPVQF